jgi:hypothetical protein
MEIPPDVRIKATITKGSVYYFKDESHEEDAPSHYFVVINAEPLSDRILILVCASSQLDKLRGVVIASPLVTQEIKDILRTI